MLAQICLLNSALKYSVQKKKPRKRKLALSIMQLNEELVEALGVFPCLYDKSKIIPKTANIVMNPWKQVCKFRLKARMVLL